MSDTPDYEEERHRELLDELRGIGAGIESTNSLLVAMLGVMAQQMGLVLDRDAHRDSARRIMGAIVAMVDDHNRRLG